MIENRFNNYNFEDTNRKEFFGLNEEPVLDVFRGSGFEAKREYIGSFTSSVCINLLKLRELLRHHDPESMEFSIYWHDFFNPYTEQSHGNEWH